MIDLKWKGARRLERDLQTFAKTAVPHAVRNALNTQAFEARRAWADEAKDSLTLRNTFTVRSLRVEKARGTKLETMQSRVGSVAPYMGKQEIGGQETAGGKHGVTVPTPVASGEGRGARPRRRLVRRPHKMSRINLAGRGQKGSRQQRNAIALSMARRAGRKHVMLEGRRRIGIFRISGGKRTRIDMVWHLTRKATAKVPPNPMLQRALASTERKMPGVYERAFVEQLRRRRILGY